MAIAIAPIHSCLTARRLEAAARHLLATELLSKVISPVSPATAG